MGKFNKGDSTIVKYKEIYETIYKEVEWANKEEAIRRSLIGYDFLDAQPKPKRK